MMTKKTLKSFLISAGDSSKGPVGFCMRVKAHTPEEAIEIAKAELPGDIENVQKDFEMDDAVEYLNVYFNEAALTVKDIVEGETENADDDEPHERGE